MNALIDLLMDVEEAYLFFGARDCSESVRLLESLKNRTHAMTRAYARAQLQIRRHNCEEDRKGKEIAELKRKLTEIEEEKEELRKETRRLQKELTNVRAGFGEAEVHASNLLFDVVQEGLKSLMSAEAYEEYSSDSRSVVEDLRLILADLHAQNKQNITNTNTEGNR